MRESQPIVEIVTAHKRGSSTGIASICSAQPYVLQACLESGRKRGLPILIESTCNQVNQYGGYTGMTPIDFACYVRDLGRNCGLRNDQIVMGGDHLGPLPWRNEPADTAMAKAAALVRSYVQAGFTKIHLDASMKCADDPPGPLRKVTISGRTAGLAAAAESSWIERGSGEAPCYVIGTEVPEAGGLLAGDHAMIISKPEDVAETVALTRAAFARHGIQAAWERVVAVVVQPGIEFGDDTIYDYHREAAAGLARFIEGNDQFVYEAHSTDYQTRPALRQMVEDHFAILKVGPALTFAFREAVFALAHIEEALFAGRERETSHLCDVLDAAMLANPIHWKNHYHGSPLQQRLARSFSFSDRSRYYWSVPSVQSALRLLLKNLGETPLPETLISQYLPLQYQKVRQGNLRNQPHFLLIDRIQDVLEDYFFATTGLVSAPFTPGA